MIIKGGTTPEHPVHPWYGPCDALDGGQCRECRKTMEEIKRLTSNVDFEARLAATTESAKMDRSAAEIQQELDVTGKLLEEREKVVRSIPECPAHGPSCIPHALEWIAEAKVAMKIKSCVQHMLRETIFYEK